MTLGSDAKLNYKGFMIKFDGVDVNIRVRNTNLCIAKEGFV